MPRTQVKIKKIKCFDTEDCLWDGDEFYITGSVVARNKNNVLNSHFVTPVKKMKKGWKKNSSNIDKIHYSYISSFSKNGKTLEDSGTFNNGIIFDGDIPKNSKLIIAMKSFDQDCKSDVKSLISKLSKSAKKVYKDIKELTDLRHLYKEWQKEKKKLKKLIEQSEISNSSKELEEEIKRLGEIVLEMGESVLHAAHTLHIAVEALGHLSITYFVGIVVAGIGAAMYLDKDDFLGVIHYETDVQSKVLPVWDIHGDGSKYKAYFEIVSDI